jgi:putative IMPACT (imprinted ancient) family translation regulator
MLQVLRGAKLSDLMAVVVRWYGGVKLGKGGLARAYSQVVQEALEELPTEERVPTVLVEIVVPYTRFGDLKRLVHPPEVEIVDERYADESVRLTLEVAVGRQAWLREALASLGAEPTVPGG